MSRGDSLIRQWRLIQLLNERGSVSPRQAAVNLETSVRTVYRDLEVLQGIGIPIYQEAEGKRRRWRVVDGYRHRASLRLTWPEAVALTAAVHLLEHRGDSLFGQAATLGQEKLRAALPPPLVERAERVMQHISAGLTRLPARTGSDNVALRLVTAIEERRVVRLRYRKPDCPRAEARAVEPHHLHVAPANMYLLAWCQRRSDFRIFAVRRIESVELTLQLFDRRSGFHPWSFLQGKLGAWSGDPVRVQLHFCAEVAPHVADAPIHQSQCNHWRADGSLDVALELALSPAFVAWVVGWGARVQVRSPKRLREAVLGDHRDALSAAGDKTEETVTKGVTSSS